MICTTYHVPYKYGQTIKIRPLFDFHEGNKYCDKTALRKDLSNLDDNTYLIGGGDLADAIITQDWRYAKHADASAGDAVIDEQIDVLTDLLIPYRERIIGLGDGNHEKTILKKCGTDIIQRLCDNLSTDNHLCLHLGYSWLVRLFLREDNGRGRSIIIKGHHGWGGVCRTEGGELTKYSRDMMYWDADVFLFGHGHKRDGKRIPRLGMTGDKLTSRPMLIGLCGTYLKTYSGTKDSTYGEERGYPPVEIGGITVNIKPNSRWVDLWIDI